MANDSKSVFVSKEVKEQRYNICKKCDHFLKPFKGCDQCGCFIPAKIQFAVNKCPVDKW